jgi:hypothetical protein
MALIVKIFVNQHEIIDTHVVRTSGTPPGYCYYTCPDGVVIKHKYSDGAAKLAIKMLKRIKG